MVQNNNIQTNSNIFNSFPTYNMEQVCVVKNNDGTISAQDLTTDKVEIKDKSSKTKKIILGSTIASTIISAGVLGLLLTKGLHGSSLNKLSRFREQLARDIEASNIAPKDIGQKCKLYIKKCTQKMLNFLESASNFAAVKDFGTDKALRTNKVTAKFADKSKSSFRGVVNGTLAKKYSKVQKNVSTFSSLLGQYNIPNLDKLDDVAKLTPVTIKGTTKPLHEWLAQLAKETDNLQTSYNSAFGIGAIKKRGDLRVSKLTGLPQQIQGRLFASKTSVIDPKTYRKYITQDITKTTQQEFRDTILQARKNVTNNIPSIYDDLSSQVSRFSNSLKINDNTFIESTNNLMKQLDAFKKCSGPQEAEMRKKIVGEIADSVDDIVSKIKISDYTDSEKTKLLAILEKIKASAISTNGKSKGSIEEIMTILNGLNSHTLEQTGKQIISDAELKNFSKLASKISKDLGSATELEMGEYFLKQAELEVGSAASDVISLLFPIAAGAYAIGKGDDKDERISATLTTCIPLVGSFATFIYGTTKMFSGAKNLIFSSVSAIVLGKIGNYCDQLYKKYKSSGSVVEVAKGEYGNFWTDIKPKYAQSIVPQAQTEKDKKEAEKATQQK